MNTNRLLFILIVLLVLAMTACSAATPTSVPTAVPTIAPTSVPTSTPAPDPAAVVQSFWDAMGAGDLDGAMLLVAEDVKCRGTCYLSGTESFRSLLQGYINAGLTTEISDLKVEGDTVSYFYKVLRNNVVVEESAEVETMQVLDGKILLWNNLRYF